MTLLSLDSTYHLFLALTSITQFSEAWGIAPYISLAFSPIVTPTFPTYLSAGRAWSTITASDKLTEDLRYVKNRNYAFEATQYIYIVGVAGKFHYLESCFCMCIITDI